MDANGFSILAFPAPIFTAFLRFSSISDICHLSSLWMRWKKAGSCFDGRQQHILNERFLFERCLKPYNFLFSLVTRTEADSLSQGFAESFEPPSPPCGSAASSRSSAAADAPTPDP